MYEVVAHMAYTLILYNTRSITANAGITNTE